MSTSGDVELIHTLKGSLSLESSIEGRLSNELGLNAELSSKIENRYVGDYTFTPSQDDQIINTDYRLLTQDLTIKGIPYYEVSNDINSAIAREKQLKGGSRKAKLDLIEIHNPNWNDLYYEII